MYKRLILSGASLVTMLMVSCAAQSCGAQSVPIAAAESAPAGVPDADAPGGIVTARDGKLWIGTTRYRFVGVNIYSLASVPLETEGFHCGRGFTDAQVRDTLEEVAEMGANVVRVQAYQSHTDGAADFSRIDLIVRTARELGLKVVFTLENQWEDCTQGGYKYASWYKSKFRKPYGTYRRSYKEYVRDFVTHFRGEPAVLMYQLMNESESVSPSEVADPEALLGFVREMTEVVKRHDPDHLLSFGTSGVLKPGSGGPFYALLHLVEGIDVVEAHDYNNDKQGMPESIRLARLTARQIRKPFFVGEVGIDSPPMSKAHRSHYLKRKLQAAWEEDVDGVLIWSYRSGDGGNKDFGPKDPLVPHIRHFSKTNGVTRTP